MSKTVIKAVCLNCDKLNQLKALQPDLNLSMLVRTAIEIEIEKIKDFQQEIKQFRHWQNLKKAGL